MNETNENPPVKAETETDEYQSVNSENIEAARAANNVWIYKDREKEMYVANGYVESATEILNPTNSEPTGAIMIHKFQWTKEAPFITRERAFSTSLLRVGRSTKQKVKTTQLVPVNADLYAELIQGGIIRRTVDGQPIDITKTREEMLEFARIYPEGASEAIETWFDSATIELLDDTATDNFDWIFENQPVRRVLWFIGDRDNPVAAGILTFKSPPRENRAKFDEDVQNIESERRGDVNSAEVTENFAKKLQYGATYLSAVEGIAVETEGQAYTDALKQKFITLFNPIWFADCVEAMHESFNFTKGKSGKN